MVLRAEGKRSKMISFPDFISFSRYRRHDESVVSSTLGTSKIELVGGIEMRKGHLCEATVAGRRIRRDPNQFAARRKPRGVGGGKGSGAGGQLDAACFH